MDYPHLCLAPQDTLQVFDLCPLADGRNYVEVYRRNEVDAAITALEDEIKRLKNLQSHAQCHDIVCSGDRRMPRGASGVSCSCKGRDGVYGDLEQCRKENEQLKKTLEGRLL